MGFFFIPRSVTGKKWSDALNAIGIPKRKYRNWTEQLVLDAVKKRYHSGLSLANRALLLDDSSLLVQIRKYYGNKRNALRACGIVEQKISKNHLLAILNSEYLTTGRLHSGALREMKIYNIMLKYFGSKTNAYKAIGLSDKEIKKIKLHSNKWTEETIVEAILQLKQKGEKFSGGYINKTNPSLYRAARTHFGSWAQALQGAGIDYPTPKVYKKYTKWNREKILEKLKNLLIRYGNNKHIPSEERFKYYWLCQRYFGSSKEAWMAIGQMRSHETQNETISE